MSFLFLQLPECPSATKFGRAIARTVKAYVESSTHLPREHTPAVLVVVSEDETNIFDQHSIEEAVLLANPSIRILRRTFKQLTGTRVNVENSTGRLFVYVFFCAPLLTFLIRFRLAFMSF